MIPISYNVRSLFVRKATTIATALGIGLGLWFTAELSWMYYVQVMKVDVPFPSFADLFYLSGYIFVGVFLRFFRKAALIVGFFYPLL